MPRAAPTMPPAAPLSCAALLSLVQLHDVFFFLTARVLMFKRLLVSLIYYLFHSFESNSASRADNDRSLDEAGGVVAGDGLEEERGFGLATARQSAQRLTARLIVQFHAVGHGLPIAGVQVHQQLIPYDTGALCT
jgi:hypothetical protein